MVDTVGQMFTGIITATSTVLNSHQTANGLELTIKTPTNWTDLEVGESLATNGVCLTISHIRSDTYEVFLIPETLAKTTFGKHVPERVNLERSLSASDRFGGHFVQGHVDTTGKVIQIDQSNGYVIKIAYPKNFKKLVIPKGSITVDGVALTVVTDENNTFSVALIPHTLEHTTLGSFRQGDDINLEFDMLGKYVVNMMKLHATS